MPLRGESAPLPAPLRSPARGSAPPAPPLHHICIPRSSRRTFRPAARKLSALARCPLDERHWDVAANGIAFRGTAGPCWAVRALCNSGRDGEGGRAAAVPGGPLCAAGLGRSRDAAEAGARPREDRSGARGSGEKEDGERHRVGRGGRARAGLSVAEGPLTLLATPGSPRASPGPALRSSGCCCALRNLLRFCS